MAKKKEEKAPATAAAPSTGRCKTCGEPLLPNWRLPKCKLCTGPYVDRSAAWGDAKEQAKTATAKATVTEPVVDPVVEEPIVMVDESSFEPPAADESED